MATRAEIGKPADQTNIPLRRLLARAARLSSPALVVLLGLLLTGFLHPAAAMVGLFVAFACGSLLAHARERRLLAVQRQLQRLMVVADDQEHGFDLLGGDALPLMTEQLERSLERMRAHQDELDHTLSTLVDALPDPLMLIQANRTIERANRAAVRLFERDSTGHPVESVLRDPGLLAAVDDVLDGSDEAQVNLQLPGPPARAFGVLIVPCRWHDQPAALVSLRELTEQMAIERMRSDFVANASHELRTPLTVIRGFVETLAGPARDDPEARTRFLTTMGAEAERMSRLVDDLLSLSKIEQNEHVSPAERIQLTEIIGSVVDALRPYAEERRVVLKVRADKDLPPVLGDRDQLSQLFTNLIDNAIKYGVENDNRAGEHVVQDEVSIDIRYVPEAPPGAGPLTGRPTIEAVVRDRGAGIAAEHLPRLTERFFRVDRARSRRLGGTGLGLAIVKHILRRHRGHLAFESEVGKGTAVTVHLVVG